MSFKISKRDFLKFYHLPEPLSTPKPDPQGGWYVFSCFFINTGGFIILKMYTPSFPKRKHAWIMMKNKFHFK